MPKLETRNDSTKIDDPFSLMRLYSRNGKPITDTDRALDLLVDGVTILTTTFDKQFYGLAVSWITRISGSPYLVLAAVSHNSHTRGYIFQSGFFAINILGQNQVDVARHFGRQTGSEVNKFKRQDHYWETRQTGAPILLSALGYLDCKIITSHDPQGSDHTLFIGEVLDAGLLREGQPLIFRRDDFPYRVRQSET